MSLNILNSSPSEDLASSVRVSVMLIFSKFMNNLSISLDLPDITGRTASAVRPDVLNAKYHVITNATYSCHNHDAVSVKFKHVTNIETCTLLYAVIISRCRNMDANMVENGGHCFDQNGEKRQNSRKISMDRLIKVYEKTSVSNIIHVSYIS